MTKDHHKVSPIFANCSFLEPSTMSMVYAPAKVVEPTMATKRRRSAPGPLYFLERNTTRNNFTIRKRRKTRRPWKNEPNGRVETKSKIFMIDETYSFFDGDNINPNIHSKKNKPQNNNSDSLTIPLMIEDSCDSIRIAANMGNNKRSFKKPICLCNVCTNDVCTFV